MRKTRKSYLLLLVVLNCLVLLGQLWPAGAPPFARTINIVFLMLSLLFFLSLMRKKV